MNIILLKELLKDLQNFSFKIEKGMYIEEEEMVKILEKIKKIKKLFT